MNKHCSDCDFWGDKNATMFGDDRYRTCTNEKLIYFYKNPNPDREFPIDGLVYDDHEGYEASLHVGPEFGCIHWEARQWRVGDKARITACDKQEDLYAVGVVVEIVEDGEKLIIETDEGERIGPLTWRGFRWIRSWEKVV